MVHDPTPSVPGQPFDDLARIVMTERKQAAQALHRSEERLHLALEAARTGVWEWNVEGMEIFWSDEVYQMHGFTKEDIAESDEGYARLLDFIHPDDMAQAIDVINRAMEAGDDYEIEYRVQHPDGSTHWMQAKGRLYLSDDGDLVRIAGTVQDITERKRYEAELIEAKKLAEEMIHLKDSLLANISHEIRTPLAGILGFADILAGTLGGEQQEWAACIKKSGQRLLGMLNSVLDLARLETKTLDVCWQTTDVVEEVRDVVRLLRPLADEKGLELQVVLAAPELPAVTDPALLHRILTNLVSNAIKFTKQGYVVVRVRSDATRFTIQVQDTGIGIAEEFFPYLFDEFRQESTGLARSHQGTGLGLAITKSLVDMLDGCIEVESVKGQGSCFTASFPLAPRVDDPGPPFNGWARKAPESTTG